MDAKPGGDAPAIVIAAIFGAVCQLGVLNPGLPFQIVAVKEYVQAAVQLTVAIASARSHLTVITAQSDAVGSVAVDVGISKYPLETLTAAVERHQAEPPEIALVSVTVPFGEVGPKADVAVLPLRGEGGDGREVRRRPIRVPVVIDVIKPDQRAINSQLRTQVVTQRGQRKVGRF